MKDAADRQTLELLPSAKRGRGRPKKPNAMTPAQRAAAYRQRVKERAADLKDEAKPLYSAVIDLSALPVWKVTTKKPPR